MTRTRLILTVLAVLALSCAGFAQISHGGSPASLNYAMQSAADTRAMPPVDHATLLAEDETEGKDVPLRFGYPHEVNFNLNNSGTWEDTKDGRVWRLRIQSRGAYSINLVFDQFDMPEGGKLFIYNDNHDYVIGAFTEENEFPTGEFSTQPVPGDAITLEYVEPFEAQGQGVISVMRVVHAYRNMFGYGEDNPLDNFGDSGSCNNNVNCPEGALWQDQKRGVVMLLTSGGSRFCSGSLINNTNNNATPYVLTANHCTPSTTTVFMFNYESPSCANVNGPTNQTVAGCAQIFNSSPSDVYLVRMNSAAPLSYNPYFSGWNANDVAATNSVCIHHPSGDIKKITFDNQAPVSSTWSGTPANSHWRILTWEDGTTEPGSSGSPLFDQNHRITGQLHGGTASCSNNIDDYFGKFALSMTNGLRTHLDPGNSGVMTLDGFDPQAGGFVRGTVTDATTLTPLEGVTVQEVGGARTTTTNASGYYFMALPDGATYDLAFSKFAYVSDTITGINITEGDTVTADLQLTALPIITVMDEDFESGAPGWTHASAGGSWVDDWHISTERSRSTSHSYKCGSTTTGTYQALNDARLTSPVLANIPDGAQLSFWMQMEGEVSSVYSDSAYDGGILEISQNGGAFVRVETTEGYTEVFRYTVGGGTPATGPMLGQPCWSGTVTTWTEKTMDLSGYAGSDIQLRFRFGSDNSVQREGWYVDDVMIQAVGEISPLVTPTQVTIEVSGDDVILRWADDANPYYRIYASDDVDNLHQTLVGDSDTNTFTVIGGAVLDGPRYYSVVGWDGN
ncbi:MAG: carboxypeptidase regulatory-like domain-containing protein [Calditrichaeota bacterium]|nr:carboxypeptidase regulatory-like domain-containing protein [Calditrichota bacterium]